MSSGKQVGRIWAILLAAGDGTRIQGLTHDQSGAPVPKQFWSVDGQESMLRWAVKRAARTVSWDRIVTVVAAQHRRWWETELSDLPRANVVVQPENKGTGPGILLPLLHVLRQDPLARVVVLPSDHYVSDEALLREAIVRATAAAEEHRDRVVLLGMTPTGADVEYGWIVPVDADTPVRHVSLFVEKPDRARVRTLMSQGAVLNSLILVATGTALLQLYATSAPELSEEFATWVDGGDDSWARLQGLYRDVPKCDFSRHVLEHSCDRLDVVGVGDCGWSDLGTPTRLNEYRAATSPVPRDRREPGALQQCRPA